MADQIAPAETFKQSDGNLRELAEPRGPESGEQPVGAALGRDLPRIMRRAKLDIGSLRPNEIRILHQTIGNQAVARLIANARQQKRNPLQAKLTIGAPDDVYEKEADSVAERVVSNSSTLLRQGGVAGATGSELRRKCACGGGSGEECPDCRMKRLSMQRHSSSGDAGAEAPPIVEDVLSTPGQPLAEVARKTLEPGFGHDFSDVRVHDDSKAAESASAVNAHAYTVGNHVVFGQGQYAPGTTAGQHLIAHELTHTIQQTGGRQPGNDLARLAETRPAAETHGTVLRQPTPPAGQATTPGTAPAPAPGQATQTPGTQQVGPPVSSPEDKRRFLDKCSQVNTHLDVAHRATAQWLASLSLAYRDAWKNHTDALKDQAESERLVGDLILGAALAFIPGGVGGVIGAAMKSAKQSDFMIDGIKDLAKWGLRSTGQAGLKGGIGPTGGGSSGLTVFPDDPGQWRDTVDMRVQGEILAATRILENWQARANADDIDFDMSFDPVIAMDKGLTIAGQPVSALAPVDIPAQSVLYEKGFWKTWLEKFGYKLVGSAGRVGVFYGAESNAGKKVRNRCKAIGLPIEAYVAVSQQQIEDEARRRNAAAHGLRSP